MTGETLPPLEHRLIHRDGSVRWVRNTPVPRYDERHRLVAYDGSIADITERKRAEEALRETEEKFSKAFRSSPDFMIVSTLAEGRFVEVNDAFTRITGYRLDEVIGRTIAEVGIWADPGERAAMVRMLQEKGAIRDQEYHFRMRSGEVRLGQVSAELANIRGEVCIVAAVRDITERQWAEEALRESEERYRELFEAESDAIFLIDNETGRILEANSAASALYGYNRDEFLTRKNTDLSAEPEETQRVTHGTPVISDRIVTIPLRFHLKRDGTVFPVEITGRFFTRQGRPVHLAAIRDISERKRAEEALRDKESQLRQLTESLPQLIWTCRPEGPCDYLSRQWIEYTGIPEAEQLGYGWLEQLHPDDRERVKAEWSAVAQSGAAFDIEFRIRCKDGAYRWFKTRAMPIRDTQGKLLKWYGSNTDIEDMKRAEEEVRSLAKFPSENPNPILRADRDGTVLYANEACAPLLHLWRSEVGSALPGDYRALIVEALQTGALREIEVPSDGQLFSIILVPVVRENYVNFYGRDITERQRAEQALVQRTRQLDAIRVVTAEITSELNLTTLLDLILRRALELVGATTGTIYLWEEADQVLVPQTWQGPYRWLGELRLRAGEGVAGTVAQRRCGMIVNDFRASPYATPFLLERSTHTAVLAEPLLYHGRLLGVVAINNVETGRPFTDQDQRVIALFSGQAAIAIENARLHSAAVRRGEELAALLRAARTVMSGLDLQTTFERITEEAAHIAGTPHVQVLLVDKEARVLRVAALHGMSAWHLGFVLPVGTGLSGLVAQTGQPVFSEDLAQDPRSPLTQQDRELGLVTYLGLPIKLRDELLGVLNFKTTAPRHYTPDEVAYLTSFADQAAIAIENARLFRGERIRREQLEAIRAVADEITRELDLTALLQLIARRAAELTHVSSSTVWLWDEANQLLTPGAWHGYGAWMRGRRLQLGEGVSGAVAERREGLLVNDYGSSPYRLTAVLEHSKTTAMLAEPLLYRGKLLGVIRIAAEVEEREFTTEDQHLLRLFAAQASIAIENAQLFAELEQSSRDLLVAQEQFVRTEKLRALGRMAAGIAHNLNNTLAAILGQVQLLQLQRVEPAMQEALETLATAASDGAAVVRRLQGFARQQPQHPLLPCDLVALVAEAMALTRPQLRDAPQRRGHVIEVRTALAASGGLPLVLGVPTEIREALTNLILNAVDAMPTGGTLTFSAQVVRTEGEQLGNQAITQPGGLEPQIAEVPEGWVDLTVTDTGVGMPDEVRQRIFDPFFTTKGVRGSGLGLSMVYGIMERHGGSIQVASAPGQGTTVTLRFQVARTSTPVPDAAIPLPSGPARRILLIEDDPVVRRTLASLLRTGGHIVEEADGGPAGLTRLTEKPVDLVLTDLGMPELNGWEVARQVKARHPDLPVVLLTGWGEQLEDSGDIPAGLVDRVLGKPVRLEDLLTTIAELTGGSTT